MGAENRLLKTDKKTLSDLESNLHKVLDFKDLLEVFKHTLSTGLDFSSIEYKYETYGLSHILGNSGENQAHFHLALGDVFLGDLVITAEQPFNEAQLKRLKFYVQILMYPLRNALKYYTAVLHSYTDILTNTNNRASFEEQLGLDFQMAKRHRSALSLLLIDLDNFKSINDQYGHTGGDAILIEWAKRAKLVIRGSERIFRLGGDEFAVLLPQTNMIGAEKLAVRLCKATSETLFPCQGQEVRMSTSIGVGCIEPNDVNTDEFFERTDAALYKAKEAGKNQTCTQLENPSPLESE